MDQKNQALFEARQTRPQDQPSQPRHRRLALVPRARLSLPRSRQRRDWTKITEKGESAFKDAVLNQDIKETVDAQREDSNVDVDMDDVIIG